MPEEYKGELRTSCGYTKTQPRAWTEKEIEWLEDMIKRGHSTSEIAHSMGRTEVSVSIKKKRLGKSRRTYNQKHINEKYDINYAFLDYIKPKTVLDAYSGDGFYDSEKYDVITNDISEEFNTEYHKDALKLLCMMYSSDRKFDIIDLDPFGSAYDCFDLAIKMAKKGIIITLGELGHKRWKRLDFVRTHYGIDSLKDFTIENIISEIQKIGKRNKKELTVWNKREWERIGRVWFTVKKHKITEQWSKDCENR